MKRLLTLLFFLSYTLCQAQGTITASPNNVCYVNNMTGTASITHTTAATSFSWFASNGVCTSSVLAASGSTVQFQFTCCGTTTITCVGFLASAPIWTAMTTVMLHCPPAVTATLSSDSLCAGKTATLNASGASSYAVSGGISLGIGFIPAGTACYTVVGSSAMGCTASAVECVTVFPVPSVAMFATSTVICMGEQSVLSPSMSPGATYSWNTGWTQQSYTVTPLTSTCYTAGVTSPAGCTGYGTVCVIVNPLPFVAASTNSSTVCPGQTATLVAFGAMTYTWVPGSLTGAMIVVGPMSSTMYTVIGSNGFCTNQATVSVNVLSAPPLSIQGNTNVCKGSSTSLSITGAPTFTWSHNNSSLPVQNFLPTTSTLLIVNGHAASGCTVSAPVAIAVLTTCAMVWPGDANYDGIVNATDVLELGIYANTTGTARNPGGNNYVAQFATAFAVNGSNGQDLAHADCNGDGTVNSGDTLAITNNWLLPHNFRVAKKGMSTSPVKIVMPATIEAGESNALKAEIFLGDAAQPVQNIYGIQFDLEYDPAQIQANSAHVSYPSSFIDAGNTNIPFRRKSAAGLINCVSVRTDQTNVSGHGKFAEFYFMIDPSLMNELVTVSVTNVQMIDKHGTPLSLDDASSSSAVVDVSGVNSFNGSKAAKLFPNPVTSVLYLENGGSEEVSFTMTDVTGRTVLSGTFKSATSLDVSALSKGTYIVSLQGSDTNYRTRVIVAD